MYSQVLSRETGLAGQLLLLVALLPGQDEAS